MIRRPPRSTRTDTLFPYTTLFRYPRIGSSKSLAEKNVIFLAGLIESNFDMMTIAPGLLPRHISFGDPREPREAHVRAVVKTFEPGAPATSPAEYSILLLDVFRHPHGAFRRPQSALDELP